MRSVLNLANATANPGSPLAAYAATMGQMISRRQAEDTLRAAAIESAMANRAKSEFLANMSHELRTPLNAIIGFSELVEMLVGQSDSQEKVGEYAKLINGAGKHLLAIINDILSVSEIESGKLKLKIEAVDFRETAEVCCNLLRTRIEQKNQNLIINVADSLPLLAVDELRLKQILINLLTNASKFTPEGGTIQVVATVPPNDVLTFAIKDNGIGLTEAEVKYVLMPFAQANSTYSRDQEGTGLGLPIVESLVRRHMGTLDISSTPGEGTTVSVSLPVAQTDLAA